MNKAVKPVMVGGVKMRWPGKAQDAFIHLSEAGDCSGSPLPLYNNAIFNPVTQKQMGVTS